MNHVFYIKNVEDIVCINNVKVRLEQQLNQQKTNLYMKSEETEWISVTSKRYLSYQIYSNWTTDYEES